MRSLKKGGIVGDLVSGTGGLIVLVVIMLVIVSTLLTANLFTRSTQTINITDEGHLQAGIIYLNQTGWQLGNSSNSSRSSYSVWSLLCNGTTTVTSGNWTINASGTIFNSTAGDNSSYHNCTANYSFTFTEESTEENVAKNLSLNLTSGIRNVSGKVPTILLIAAVVLLFGVLVLLVMRARSAGFFVGGSGGGASL
jgi:hypothetical protein